MQLTFEVLGDRQIARKLERFGERAQDMTPLFRQLVNDFYSIERDQFRSEGSSGSGGWAPLRPATVAARGNAHPILTDTGDLRASLTRPSAKGAVSEIGPDGFFVGTDIDYAHFHQRGTSRMPRRRPVELTGADRTAWVKALQRFLIYGGGSERL